MQSRSMFVKSSKHYYKKLSCNKYVYSNEILEIKWRNVQSEPYHVNYLMIYKRLLSKVLDSWFYYERLIILLKCTVSNVPSSCFSIKLYRTVVNIETKLIGKKYNWIFLEEILKKIVNEWITGLHKLRARLRPCT